MSWPLAWHEEPLPLREDEEHLPWHEESESLREEHLPWHEEHLPWHEETLPLYEQEEHWLPSVDPGVDKGEAYVDLLDDDHDEDYVDPLDNFHDSLPPREELYELLSHPAHHNGEEPLYIFSGHELLDHSTQHNAQAIQHDEVENDEDASDHEATPVLRSRAAVYDSSAKQVKRKRPAGGAISSVEQKFSSVKRSSKPSSTDVQWNEIFSKGFEKYIWVRGEWTMHQVGGLSVTKTFARPTQYHIAYNVMKEASRHIVKGSTTRPFSGPVQYCTKSTINLTNLGQLVQESFNHFVAGKRQHDCLYFDDKLRNDPLYTYR